MLLIRMILLSLNRKPPKGWSKLACNHPIQWQLLSRSSLGEGLSLSLLPEGLESEMLECEPGTACSQKAGREPVAELPPFLPPGSHGKPLPGISREVQKTQMTHTHTHSNARYNCFAYPFPPEAVGLWLGH